MKLLSGNHNMNVVGDDDQSIYSFRGSNPDLMRKFIQDFDAKTICLAYNYRSNQDIVELANQLIINNKNRFTKDFMAVKPPHNSVFLFENSRKENIYHFIKKEIHEYAINNPQKTQAILTRTNGLAYAYQNIINDVTEDVSFYEDMLAYLSFINDGQKRSDFIKIMNKPVRYISTSYLVDSVIDFKLLAYRVQPKTWISERIASLQKQIEYAKKLDLIGQIRYIYKAIGYEKYCIEQKGMQPSLLNMLYHSFLEDFKKVGDIQQFKDDFALKEKNREKNKSIKIMTYHASKGLEFDRVYLPDLDYGKVPHGRMLTKEEIEEERRMFYVAITRAKESLLLLRDKSQIGSPFLQEIILPHHQ